MFTGSKGRCKGKDLHTGSKVKGIRLGVNWKGRVKRFDNDSWRKCVKGEKAKIAGGVKCRVVHRAQV